MLLLLFIYECIIVVFAQKPIVVEVVFDASFQELKVRSSRLFPTTEVARPLLMDYNNCSHVLSGDMYDKIGGADATCYMTSFYTIKVLLPKTADVYINDTVIVNTANLALNTTLLVSGPEDFKPVMSVLEPTSTTYCKDQVDESFVYISADLSYNQGYRKFTNFTPWNTWYSKGTVTPIDTKLVMYTGAQVNGETVRNDDSTNIVVNMGVSNVLGETAEENITFPFIVEDFIPYVRVTLGSVVNKQQRFQFNVLVKYPYCWPQKRKPDLFWSIQEMPSKNVLLKNVISNKNMMLVGSPTDLNLKVNTDYNVFMTVNSRKSTGKPETIIKKVEVHLKSRPLEVKILGGGRSLGKDDILNLTSCTYDPDNVPGDGSVKWECFQTIDMLDNLRCMLNDEEPLKFDEAKIITFKFQGQLWTEVERPIYFRVTVTKGARSASDFVSVQYNDIRTIRGSVYVHTHKPSYYVDESVILHPEIVGKYYGKFVIRLKQCLNMLDPEPKFDVLPNSIADDSSQVYNYNATYESNLPKSVMQSRTYEFRLPKNLFRVGSQLRCDFDFMLSPRSGIETTELSASVYFNIIPHKIFPEISVYPETGYGWKTKFLLRARDWIAKEEELPLLFRFGYIDKNNTRTKVYINAWTTDNLLEDVRIPIFSEDADETNMTVFAEVRNQQGYQTTVETIILLMFNDTAREEYYSIQYQYQYFYNIGFFGLAYNVYLLRSLEIRFGMKTSESMGSALKNVEEEFLAADMHSDSARQILSLIGYLVMTYETTNTTHPAITTIDSVLGFLSDTDHFKMWEKDFDYYIQLNEILEWMNKLVENPADHDKIFANIKNFLALYPQKVCSAIHSDYTKTNGRPFKSNYKLINVNIYRERFIDNYNDGKTIFQRQSEYRDTRFTNDEDRLKVHTLENLYGTWECNPYFPHGCNGFCFSEVHYHQNISQKVSENLKSTLNAISDMYELALYNPEIDCPFAAYDDMKPEYVKSRRSNIDYVYRMRIPVTDDNVTSSDHMRCHMINIKKDALDYADYCKVKEEVLFDDPNNENGSFALDCSCRKLGRIICVRDAIPTEYPTLLDALNMTLYFYGKRDRCEDTKKRKTFLEVFLPELAKLTKILESRIHYVGCTFDKDNFILMNLKILDVMGSKRTYDIEDEITAIIENHFKSRVKFDFDDGRKDSVELYDILKVTPKPSPSPLPPFTDVTTNWIPIFLGLASISMIFVCCVCIVFCVHTRKLKDEKYTEINSDQPPPKLTEEERIKQMNKRSKDKRMNEITEEAIDMEDFRDIGLVVPRKGKKRQKIGPISDFNAIATTGNTNFGSGTTDSVDEPVRYALDDEADSEECSADGIDGLYPDLGTSNSGFQSDNNADVSVDLSEETAIPVVDMEIQKLETETQEIKTKNQEVDTEQSTV